MNLGAAVLTVATLAVIGWLGYLLLQSRVRHRREAPPQNLSPYMTDDELENKRLDKVLFSALVTTAILAIVLPVYYLNENSRQHASAERFDEIAVERGHEWFADPEHGFGCYECHGIDGGGGAASYVEARSGLSVSWAAPALNDIFYRYDAEDIRYWIVYGRQGTPMPAWGVPGGGPLNEQQVDELIEYIRSIQLPQSQVVTSADARVQFELNKILNADATVDRAISDQQAEIDALMAIPGQHEAVKGLPARLNEILTGPATCTDETAAAVAKPCNADNPDRDRDGISDDAEIALDALIEEMVAAAPPSDPRTKVAATDFDPDDPFTTSEGGTPVPDLEHVPLLVTEFNSIARDLRLTNESIDRLLAAAQSGLEFLLNAREERLYAFDIPTLAAEHFDGNVTEAQRAVGLFNAYCARCHTAGYSAGVPYTKEAGSGALGPSLRDGRSIVQFPDIEDHFNFVVRGSENGKQYGVNGIGKGWMPGFGAMLTRDDLMLIVEFERSLGR